MSYDRLGEDFYELFPFLNKNNHIVTSSPAENYNCIAWAAADDEHWWWPCEIDEQLDRIFWPQSVPREETLEAFSAAFETLGYQKCDDGSLEEEYEKIVVFAKGNVPKHAARQLENGWWTSKLGPSEDIAHRELNNVSGDLYGHPVIFMRRKRENEK